MSSCSESDSQPFDQVFEGSFQSSSASTSRFNYSNIQISLQLNHNFAYGQPHHCQSAPQIMSINLGDAQNQSQDEDSQHSFDMQVEPPHIQQFEQWYEYNRSEESSSFAQQEFEFQSPVSIDIDEEQSFERDSPFFPAVKQEGLQVQEIKNIPTMVWSAIHQRFNKGEKCSVCLEEYEIGKVLRVMPCLHRYHLQCLDEWLQMRANCPNCRTCATNL